MPRACTSPQHRMLCRLYDAGYRDPSSVSSRDSCRGISTNENRRAEPLEGDEDMTHATPDVEVSSPLHHTNHDGQRLLSAYQARFCMSLMQARRFARQGMASRKRFLPSTGDVALLQIILYRGNISATSGPEVIIARFAEGLMQTSILYEHEPFRSIES